jgi:molecular chaperone GrpE
MSDNHESEDKPGLDSASPVADSPAAAAETTPPIPTPEERVAALEVEKAELKDRMLRIAAEFENYKKRTRKEMSEHEAKTREAVLRDFLDIADNLQRAIASWTEGGERDVKSVQDGVELVLRLFKSKLERYSVTAIETKGQPFDPRLHDAISQAPSSEATPGTVLHELQKGYRVGERLLRPAIVVVAVAPPAPPAKTNQSNESEAPAGGGDIDVTEEDEQGAAPSAERGEDKPS